MSKQSPEQVIDRAITLIAQRRKELGWSHETLGEKAGMHRTTVGVIERKERMPSILNCYRLCEAMGLSLAEILKKAE